MAKSMRSQVRVRFFLALPRTKVYIHFMSQAVATPVLRAPLRIGSLFSGIGGLERGLELSGLGHTVWQVEKDAYCRAVLERHWPTAKRFEDVRLVGAATLPAVDLICGGFPCQPVSVAGPRKAQKDERWLWPQFARILAELRPALAVIENVQGLRTAGLRDLLVDLAALGFDAEWEVVSAGALGAPHLRKRMFLVASHPSRIQLFHEPGWLGRKARASEAKLGNLASLGPVADASCERRLEQAWKFARERGWFEHCGWEWNPSAGVHDGVPRGIRGRARKALGNAVVPQVAKIIGQAILEGMTS